MAEAIFEFRAIGLIVGLCAWGEPWTDLAQVLVDAVFERDWRGSGIADNLAVFLQACTWVGDRSQWDRFALLWVIDVLPPVRIHTSRQPCRGFCAATAHRTILRCRQAVEPDPLALGGLVAHARLGVAPEYLGVAVCIEFKLPLPRCQRSDLLLGIFP